MFVARRRPVERYNALCQGSDAVGDLIRLIGYENSLPVVAAADVRLPETMPAVGIILRKSSPTKCWIQRLGTVDVGSFGLTELIPGRRYFVGYDGRPTANPPSLFASGTGHAMVQPIGVAVSPRLLELTLDRWFVKVRTDGMPPIPTNYASSLISATTYACPAEAIPGDLVYLESPDTVGLALATSEATMPCFGVVWSKPDSTHCYVQFAGEVSRYSDLIPDIAYYVSMTTPGKPSATPPDGSVSGSVLQKVGSPRNSSTLLLSVDIMDYFIL